MEVDFGNPGSRTHEYGARAKEAVERAREQVAAVVRAKPAEVIFTSGATESNNLALLGLLAYGEETEKRHIISSQGEHKAVLEPLARAQNRGFRVTLLPLTVGGFVDPESVRQALRPDTLLVSLMHVNNETGVEQPLDAYSSALAGHAAFFHVDAAQSFGKRSGPLHETRIDLISISGHKIYAPKGVGALVVRRRGFDSVPLEPVSIGGGQERGLRPGTLPVPLIVGLGEAARLSRLEEEDWVDACRAFRDRLLVALGGLPILLHGDQSRTLPHTVNLSIGGVDGEAAILALKDLIAASNGSACTSAGSRPSHVLLAMGLNQAQVGGAIRLSWCHKTPDPDWEEVRRRVQRLL